MFKIIHIMGRNDCLLFRKIASQACDLRNMQDPGILDPRHFFFPRHFDTIYAIFTQFYVIVRDFCAILHAFYTILRDFCDFYAIFAIFTRFLARQKF